MLLGGYTRRSSRAAETAGVSTPSPGISASSGDRHKRPRETNPTTDSLADVGDPVPTRLATRRVRFAEPLPAMPVSPVSELHASVARPAGFASSDTHWPVDITDSKCRNRESAVQRDEWTDHPQSPAQLVNGTDPPCSDYDRLYIDLVDRVREATLSDPETNSPDSRKHWGLQEIDGLLWRGSRLYIPQSGSLRSDLLYWHHDVPWCAHLGAAKTVRAVKTQFYWPKMDQSVEDYVSSCHLCQANKADRRNRTPPLTPLVTPDAAFCF